VTSVPPGQGELLDFTDSTVIPYGLAVMYSMDIYRQKTCPPAPFTMPPPPTGGGVVIGFVMGTDSVQLAHPKADAGLLGALTAKVCYGAVIRRGAAEVVVALRGTDGFREWAEDGEFLLVPYAPANPLPPETLACRVEQGFWRIYQSLVLTDIHGTVVGPLAESLPPYLDHNDNVVVSGHSLGAPLATYLTLDLARGPLGGNVSSCYFASPHPGNADFAMLFDKVIGQNYVVYNYVLDLVPRVPPLGYSALRRVRVILPATAQADITLDIGCNHHVVCYLAMLDYETTMKAITPVPVGEEGSARCIRGPRTAKPTAAQLVVDRILEVAGALPPVPPVVRV
jgi:triacylglycerol lipase